MSQQVNKRYWFICIILLVCAGCQNGSSFRSTQVVDSEALLVSVQSSPSMQLMLTEGDYDQVEIVLKQVLFDQPDSLVNRTNLAILLVRTHRIESAIAELTHVLSIQSGYCPASVQLAQIYRARLEIDAAEKHYLECLAGRPEFAPALLNHGILLELYRGELALALDRYEQYQQAGLIPNKTVARWISVLNNRLTTSDTANQIAEVR